MTTIVSQPADTTTDVEPTPEQKRRAEFIAGLHAAADYLAAHPEVPLGAYPSLDITYFPRGTDAQELAGVERAAALLGVDVAPESEGSSHIAAVKEFGPVRYKALHIPKRDMDDWGDLMRIGQERKAARRGKSSDADR